jgi:hypothetical protein
MAVGLSDDHLAATATGAAAGPAFDPDDAILIRLADELHDTAEVSDATWEVLSARYRPDQLLELVLIAGWYRLLSYVINAAGVEPEPWAARFPGGVD